MGGKSRDEITTAPGERREQPKQDSHDELGGLALLHFKAENGHDFLKIFPDFAFSVRVTQEIGGMIRGEQFSSAKFEPLAAELGNAAIRLEKRLCRDGSQADDHFRRNDINLPEEKGRAGADLVLFRLSIFRRAAFRDVADVNVPSLQPHSFDHLREQLPCAAYERQALRVFIGTGAFPHKHKFGFRTSVAKNNAVPGLVELAARALAEVTADLEQRVIHDFVDGFKE
jgi:hypothetical protein